MSEELKPGQTVSLEESTKPLTEEQQLYASAEQALARFAKLLTSYEGSKKTIQQAWLNASVAPFNSEEFTFSYPEQKELYEAFMELNSIKFGLMVYGLRDKGLLEIKQSLFEKTVEEDKK